MTKRGTPGEVSIRRAGAREPGPLEDAWHIFDARHLPYRVLMLGKMFDRLTAQQMRDHAGLSLAEWRVLAHLAVLGPKSASDVSAAALVDRAEVSRAVRVLEASGYLERADHPRNRKSSLLTLTPSGQALYERVHQQRREFFSDLTRGIAPEALARLDRLLLRMARNADRVAQRRASGASMTATTEKA
ncbi:MAG TPA: MarR family transcriptional regulator [Sphingobium sp.]|nr:MarR family transcriptional regulator [Sphingobium sp.]